MTMDGLANNFNVRDTRIKPAENPNMQQPPSSVEIPQFQGDF